MSITRITYFLSLCISVMVAGPAGADVIPFPSTPSKSQVKDPPRNTDARGQLNNLYEMPDDDSVRSRLSHSPQPTMGNSSARILARRVYEYILYQVKMKNSLYTSDEKVPAVAHIIQSIKKNSKVLFTEELTHDEIAHILLIASEIGSDSFYHWCIENYLDSSIDMEHALDRIATIFTVPRGPFNGLKEDVPSALDVKDFDVILRAGVRFFKVHSKFGSSVVEMLGDLLQYAQNDPKQILAHHHHSQEDIILHSLDTLEQAGLMYASGGKRSPMKGFVRLQGHGALKTLSHFASEHGMLSDEYAALARNKIDKILHTLVRSVINKSLSRNDGMGTLEMLLNYAYLDVALHEYIEKAVGQIENLRPSVKTRVSSISHQVKDVCLSALSFREPPENKAR